MIRKLRNLYRRLIPVRQIRVGEWLLESTPNHPLKLYQQLYPFYDRFLPILCNRLQGTVVDIGANIGDTTLAILNANRSLHIVSVEPDDVFYSILSRNISSSGMRDQVSTVKSFLSSTKKHLKVLKTPTSSTGHAQEVAEDQATASVQTFVELVDSLSLKDIELVKIDTDGFDADILNSFSEYIRNTNAVKLPFVFFEMQTYLQNMGFADSGRDERRASYLSAIAELLKTGYEKFLMFDNFGAPVLMHTDISVIDQLDRYITLSQVRQNHIPMFFCDILMIPKGMDSVVLESLDAMRLSS